MTANPGGYFDPFRLSDFADPLVTRPTTTTTSRLARDGGADVPTINYPGATPSTTRSTRT
jgi:multiple sugar transport system substrate-binding protein